MTTRTRIDLLAAAIFAVLGLAVGLLLLARLAHAEPPPPDPIVLADHASPALPVLVSPLADALPPPSLWAEAWRLGVAQVAILLVVYLGGRAALDERRWVARRWPRVAHYLDRGKVWNVLSSAITIAGTLLPLAISGDLTRAAVVAQIAASASLYVHSTRRPSADGAA